MEPGPCFIKGECSPKAAVTLFYKALLIVIWDFWNILWEAWPMVYTEKLSIPPNLKGKLNLKVLSFEILKSLQFMVIWMGL